MEFLYAPWRSSYAKDISQSKQEGISEDQCIFCSHFASNEDEQNFVLRRFDNFLVMLNLYPYNPGHLLIVSNKHYAFLSDASPQERKELIEITNQSTIIVQTTLKAQGINIGMNLGKAAGAGIPSHFHMHVLPRWFGDTNFLPTLAQTKQISLDLHVLYNQLKVEFSLL